MNKYNWMSTIEKNTKRKNINEDNEDIVNKTTIYSQSNHIYFNSNIDTESAFNLNKELRNMEERLKTTANNFNIKSLAIYLHLTTNGGSIHSAFNIIDCMNSITLPIYTIVEGYVASAGTLISIHGKKRYIGKNAYMLIHELRSGVWGKMTYLEEEMTNFKKVQEHLITLYTNKTILTRKKLNKILKRDIEWNANEAIENGLVDYIY
jgi:ATP-dependent protease ClpP protease subunit